MLITTSSKENGISYTKAPNIYEHIIKASSNEGNIVLDYFCGHGTISGF